MNQSNLLKPDWSKIPAPQLETSLKHSNVYTVQEIIFRLGESMLFKR